MNSVSETEGCAIILSVLNTVYNCLDNSQSAGREHRLQGRHCIHICRMDDSSSVFPLSMGQEDPLEKEMATHSSILVWKIPWREEPGRLHPMESQRVGHK